MNLVDTSGWLEYFFDGPNASYFSEPIEDTANLVVPVVCLYEVFKKIIQVSNKIKALQAVAQMKQGHVINLDEEIALSAALISVQNKLPMADSFIYAVAQLEGAIVWTQDIDFKGLPLVNYKKACK
ncbi:MAG TPA: type II toxin-antitoxin system VapC family toxin [Candidatus Kapabacteria bacterium]|nr:type II toxin-antitoxin system VapC family toxin [Candidatus Kapabacteria bacterium]